MDDVSLLTKVLPPAISAEGETEFWTGWLAESEKTHGKFVSATPLWTIPLDDQMHTYVLMQFANGFSVVRWERRPNGAFAHAFPRHLPDLYRFVPQSPAEVVAWNQAFRVTVPLRVEGDARRTATVRSRARSSHAHSSPRSDGPPAACASRRFRKRCAARSS